VAQRTSGEKRAEGRTIRRPGRPRGATRWCGAGRGDCWTALGALPERGDSWIDVRRPQPTAGHARKVDIGWLAAHASVRNQTSENDPFDIPGCLTRACQKSPRGSTAISPRSSQVAIFASSFAAATAATPGSAPTSSHDA